MNRWKPPEEVTRLDPAQRVAFGLACAEHLYPSFALQAHTYPASLPPGVLTVTEYQDCVEALWAALARADSALSQCITEQHAHEAYSGAAEGLRFLVLNAFAALWYARSSYDHAEHALHAGSEGLQTAGELAETLLGPRPAPPPPVEPEASARIFREQREAVATHELVELERAAQAEAVAALANDADPAGLREPAQQVGARIAEWTAQLL